MYPSLRIISGKRVGTIYELRDECIVLGRSPTCEIVVPEEAASRQHAQLRLDQEGYSLVDMQSRNGTALNGLTIQGPTTLRDRDRISICSTTFEYQAGTKKVSADTDTGPNWESETIDSTVLTRINALMSAADLAREQPAAKLKAILELNEVISQTLNIDELLPQILSSLMKFYPQADRSLMIMLDEDHQLFVHSSQHRDGSRQSIDFSRTVVNTAIEDKQAILSADASRDDRFSSSETIVDIMTRSVMCAPLLGAKREPFGTVQLETHSYDKAFSESDLQVLTSLTAIAAMAIESADIHEQLMEQQLVERELSFAREVQQGFLPSELPTIAGYGAWAFYEPAGHVGGDYYDLFTLPNDRIALVVADVSGKGVPAALLMAKVSSEVKVALTRYPDSLSKALFEINNAVCHARIPGRFVTMAICVLEPITHQVEMATAGHMSPIIKRRKGEIEEPMTEELGGIPVGVSENWKFQTTTVSLDNGEQVLMFTDGITEAMDSGDAMYSDERLIEQFCALKGEAASVGQAILDDVHEHVDGHEQNDDITLLIFGRR